MPEMICCLLGDVWKRDRLQAADPYHASGLPTTWELNLMLRRRMGGLLLALLQGQGPQSIREWYYDGLLRAQEGRQQVEVQFPPIYPPTVGTIFGLLGLISIHSSRVLFSFFSRTPVTCTPCSTAPPSPA